MGSLHVSLAPEACALHTGLWLPPDSGVPVGCPVMQALPTVAVMWAQENPPTSALCCQWGRFCGDASHRLHAELLVLGWVCSYKSHLRSDGTPPACCTLGTCFGHLSRAAVSSVTD